jgi:hypothetical protein
MVQRIQALSTLFSLLLTANAVPYGKDHDIGNAKAAYFISNNAQNSVVALKINSDGTLCDGSITPTGGAGESGISGATNMPAGPDSLFSQSPLTIAGNVSSEHTSSREFSIRNGCFASSLGSATRL